MPHLLLGPHLAISAAASRLLAAVAPSLVQVMRQGLPRTVQSQRWHTAHATAEPREDPETRVKKHVKDFAKLPWELDMPAEKAAEVLGGYLGVRHLEPGSVLDLDVDQLTGILEETTNKGNTELEKAIFSHADAVTNKFFGQSVYYRGIGVKRYTIPISEVVEVAKWAFENKMGTLMLQSGELPTAARLQYLKTLVRQVLEETRQLDLEQRGWDPNGPKPNGELGLRVALSVGELPEEDYQQLYDAGARRYLLRIESSNPELYAALHPDAMSWQKRIGTGVMVGLPGQTLRDLAGDIRFFKQLNANMIGMGPYITGGNQGNC
eukprot:gene12306-12442_t